MSQTWVMVPVPPELVEPVQTLIFRRRFEEAVTRWSPGDAAQHVAGLRDGARAAARAVATATVAGRSIAFDDLATTLGASPAELRALLLEVNTVEGEARRWPMIDRFGDGGGELRMDEVLAAAILGTPG